MRTTSAFSLNMSIGNIKAIPFVGSSEKAMASHSSTLAPGKSHGRRSLVGCSPWGCEESDMTERLHFHFSLSCIGEGNGNPLQCSCLENPRDGGAWWAAVYLVGQSRTRLKRLSSSRGDFNICKIVQKYCCMCLLWGTRTLSQGFSWLFISPSSLILSLS